MHSPSGQMELSSLNLAGTFPEFARDSLIRLQYETFFYQSLIATVIYSASLATVAAIVSLPYSATNYAYRDTKKDWGQEKRRELKGSMRLIHVHTS